MIRFFALYAAVCATADPTDGIPPAPSGQATTNTSDLDPWGAAGRAYEVWWNATHGADAAAAAAAPARPEAGTAFAADAASARGDAKPSPSTSSPGMDAFQTEAVAARPAPSATSAHDRLVAFYQQHNPARLPLVDATLRENAGREDELFAKLDRKYGVNWFATLATPPTTPVASPAAAAAAAPGIPGARSRTPICGAASVPKWDPGHRFDNATFQLRPNPVCEERFDQIRAVTPRQTERLTIAYLYYADKDHLRQKVSYWTSFPAALLARIHFLVIDDGSPRDARAAPIVEAGLSADAAARVTVLEIEQDLVWNIAGARNLAFATAPTEALLLMDMDYSVPPELVAWTLARVPDATAACRVWNGFARDKPSRPHPAVTLLSKRSYWHLSGNDEDLVGHYGHTDPTFKWKTKQMKACAPVGPTGAPKLRIAEGQMGARASRDARHNGEVAAAKTRGKRPWATTVLRFSWHIAFSK
mmetsp:Transcript_15457/g.47962  ORF Transcript_15457/g.47962 Transcript_15457/m.47962 type:complete len:475 (+) Transcript_15457:188-1612(+)